MSLSDWKPRQPPLRVPLIRRDPLLASLGELLDEGGPTVGLVCAPAGFGKTTLSTQFGEALGGVATVAWADLETPGSGANDMWRAILTAFRRSSPRSNSALRGWPRAPRQSDDRFLERLRAAAAELADPTILILDDLDSVTDPLATAQLGQFVRRLPPPVRVVLSSRHDPSFALHELRLSGHLVEVRATDLAFTPAETSELLVKDGLGADDIVAVTKLTEGWPAGVQLARALLKRPGDGERLAGLFASHHAILSDYLFNEAFSSQAARSQDLLLRTSVVSVVSESLAADLTGRPDAGEAIAGMADLAPLLSRYPSAGVDEVAYRYHPLLRAYLVAELARRDRDLLRATHRLAALWYERHADYLNAIRHARSSEDSELLTLLLRRHGAGLILIGESDALLQTLAEPRMTPTAWEAVIGACAAIRCRNTTTTAQWLAYPHESGDSPDTGLELLRMSVALKLARLTGATEPTTGPGELGHVDVRGDDDLGLLVALNQTTALSGSADTASYEREVNDATNLAVSLGREIAELQCRALDAAAALGRGRFVQAGRRIAAARLRGHELERGDDPSQAFLDAIEAWVAYEALDDDSAEQYVAAWRADPGSGMDPSNRLTASRQMDLLEAFLADDDAVWFADGPTELTGLTAQAPMSLRVIGCFRVARSALRIGRPDYVRWAIDYASEQLGADGDAVTIHAMVRAAQGRGDLAYDMLVPVIEGRSVCRTDTSLIAALTISAAQSLHASRAYGAFDCLQRALAMAAATGCYRPLAEAPEEVHAVMRDQSERLGAYAAVVGDVLRYVRDASTRPAPGSPLTGREMDILRELPTLNGIDEIGQNLLVSTNTVKTHVRGIYRKLGVSSRKDAVAEARRRG
ncbi:MAG: LuxR C-terminal-related transcriptional regulator, partial [Actinomycetia bacterium]|nr:LuxR C-terminal-related transcriptional regulator [Actinomycetes bacterium]